MDGGYYNGYCKFLFKLPPEPTSSEAFLLNVVWGFAYKLLYGSKIDAILSKKSSMASSIGRNIDRKRETTQPRQYSSMGQKINIQFCFNGFEVGCAEVGNYQNGHSTDRHIDDGMLKLPKQLKNMMAKMVKARPDLIRSLKTVGFIIMGKLFKSKKVYAGIVSKYCFFR